MRPWQHVLEPLAGYLSLARKLCEEGQAYAEAWNFGPREDEEICVEALVARMGALSGRTLAWRRDETDRPREAERLRLDSEKAHTRLLWQPRWDLDTTLRAILDWHDALARGCDMRAVTLAQIAAYEARAV
jgi:CDP-glucose 4,6-dehydratase